MGRVLRQLGEVQGDGRRELAMAEPHPRLRADVLRYAGYAEHRWMPQLWRELPHGGIVLVISFGAPFHVASGDEPSAPMPSFVAGLHDRWALVGSDGHARCLQVDLTPLGGLRLLGLPMAELSNVVVPLDRLLGGAARDLADRLEAMLGWAERFALIERLLMQRMASATQPSPAVAWAWQQLHDSGGETAIGQLARDLGCSRKHLVERFRREVGLPPKTVARVLRFDRLVRRLERVPEPRWAEVAVDGGYYDQPHLIREFRELAGVTPRQWLATRHVDAGIGSGG